MSYVKGKQCLLLHLYAIIIFVVLVVSILQSPSPSISCIIVFLLVQTTITIFPLCSLLFALLLFLILLLYSFRFSSFAGIAWSLASTTVSTLLCSFLMAKLFVRLHCTTIMIVFRHVTIICYFSLQLLLATFF